MSRKFTFRLAPVIALLAVALSACSAGDDGVPPTGSQTTAPAAAPDDCGGAGAKVTGHLGRAEVTRVEVIGQCTTISIETTLADDSYATGKQICDSAAEVAYTGDINSIRVRSKSGKEISAGIAGARCLATL
jgi:hypothetical protein